MPSATGLPPENGKHRAVSVETRNDKKTIAGNPEFRGEFDVFGDAPGTVVHPGDYSNFITVLQVPAYAGKIDQNFDFTGSDSKISRGPMPESMSSCGLLKAPPASITSFEA